MNEHQKIAIRALEKMKGDDTCRAERAFRGFSPGQMNQQHGQSGKTRAEILDGYRAHDAKIDAAIAWINSLGAAAESSGGVQSPASLNSKP